MQRELWAPAKGFTGSLASGKGQMDTQEARADGGPLSTTNTGRVAPALFPMRSPCCLDSEFLGGKPHSYSCLAQSWLVGSAGDAGWINGTSKWLGAWAFEAARLGSFE